MDLVRRLNPNPHPPGARRQPNKRPGKPLDVLIRGKDLSPCARLLEALTRTGLLTPEITWEDLPDKILLHVPNSDENRQAFERCRFPIFDSKGKGGNCV